MTAFVFTTRARSIESVLREWVERVRKVSYIAYLYSFSFLGYAAVKQVHVQSDISMPPITSSRDILTRAEGVPNSKQPPLFLRKICISQNTY